MRLVSFIFFKGRSCLPGSELKASSVSETVALGEGTHERRGRAGGTKMERAAAWRLHVEEPAVGWQAGGGRLCDARDTPKPGHLQPGLDEGKRDPFADE